MVSSDSSNGSVDFIATFSSSVCAAQAHVHIHTHARGENRRSTRARGEARKARQPTLFGFQYTAFSGTRCTTSGQRATLSVQQTTHKQRQRQTDTEDSCFFQPHKTKLEMVRLWTEERETKRTVTRRRHPHPVPNTNHRHPLACAPARSRRGDCCRRGARRAHVGMPAYTGRTRCPQHTCNKQEQTTDGTQLFATHMHIRALLCITRARVHNTQSSQRTVSQG